jgi:putative SOS response-associated peptidase YedK
MCGRFTLTATAEEIQALFELPEAPLVVPRFNIAPTQPVGIVRLDSHKEREWALVQWGLIPSWAKDPSIGGQLINARAETVAEKPSFRSAFKRRRCLVPASGFYEWQRQEKRKQPYFISTQEGGPFAFAGLWERWSDPGGGEIETCTILTTEPNGLMAALHNRMPVMVEPADYALWLGGGGDTPPHELDQLRHLLRPYPANTMRAYPVSTFVNNVRNEGAACSTPLDA